MKRNQEKNHEQTFEIKKNYYNEITNIYGVGVGVQTKPIKLLKEFEVKRLLETYMNEEITFSRFVELLNEKIGRNIKKQLL